MKCEMLCYFLLRIINSLKSNGNKENHKLLAKIKKMWIWNSILICQEAVHWNFTLVPGKSIWFGEDSSVQTFRFLPQQKVTHCPFTWDMLFRICLEGTFLLNSCQVVRSSFLEWHTPSWERLRFQVALIYPYRDPDRIPFACHIASQWTFRSDIHFPRVA